MTEADLKRFLVKSIRSQGGVGHRFEDKYTVGFPDLLMMPEMGPVFFLEAKLTTGLKLECTKMQEIHLQRLTKPPFSFGAVIGYKAKTGILYIGAPGQTIATCLPMPRPNKLDSTDWEITALLENYRAYIKDQLVA